VQRAAEERIPKPEIRAPNTKVIATAFRPSDFDDTAHL
jgi:hypothetical protein